MLSWRLEMPRIVDKQRKAEAIRRAALEVFRKTGYHRTRMADIAHAAGIGKGTLYEYFENKAHILRVAFDQYFDAFRQGAARAMAEAKSPAARLLALIDFALDHVDEWRDHCAVYVDYFGAARVGDEKLVSLDEIYNDIGQTLTTLIEAAQASGEVSPEADSVATADLLISMFDGIVLHEVFAERRSDPAALKNAALLLTRNLLTKPLA
jgi:AcrR family transcriptional regulator